MKPSKTQRDILRKMIDGAEIAFSSYKSSPWNEIRLGPLKIRSNTFEALVDRCWIKLTSDVTMCGIRTRRYRISALGRLAVRDD